MQAAYFMTAWALFAAAQPAKPVRDGPKASSAQAPGDDCTARGCHAPLLKRAHVHAALKSQACTDCHQGQAPAAAATPKCKSGQIFSLATPEPQLCLDCHDVNAPAPVHGAIAARGCTVCHDAHSSENARLLRDKSATTLCLSCHGVSQRGKPAASRLLIDVNAKEVHAAVSSGDCLDCHRPHASKYQRLLKKPQPALCYECHDRKDTELYVHSAVRLGQCSTCHEPHAGVRKPILRFATNNEMCFACHADDLTGRAFVHTPAKTDCLSCHSAHGSPVPRLFKAEGNALCYGCHKGVDAGKIKHAALERYGCVGCHDPHGTANAAYLIKPVNTLCTRCHPLQADGRHVPGLTRPEGHKVQGGRDPKRQGREFSCASCHNPHGSDFAKLTYSGGAKMASCGSCHFGEGG